MSRVINLKEYKEKNYKYVWVYFNYKEEDYWVNVNRPTRILRESKHWKLLYEGLMSNEEIETIEHGQPLSTEYGMYK